MPTKPLSIVSPVPRPSRPSRWTKPKPKSFSVTPSRTPFVSGFQAAALGTSPSTTPTRSRCASPPTPPSGVLHLDSKTCPPNTTIAIFSDVHLGIHDDPALRLAVECCEREGATLTIANGDIHDCGPVAPHELKARAASLENGTLLEEAASGRWFTDWLATRPCYYGEGNHEDWINDLALRTNTVGSVSVASALGLPSGIRMLAHGYQIRLGNLVIEHGDVTLGRGAGGRNVAQSVLDKFPDQSTIVGHFHRVSNATRTSPDSVGILRSRAAYTSGHLSLPHAHQEYAGRAPNWQQGFMLIKVWYDNNKPRFTVHNIEIHRDRYGRPIFEFNGRVYR